MPELPEVETIVSDLKPVLVGAKFVELKSSHGNHVSGAIKNVAQIKGVAVSSVERRGKFINIFFKNDYVMTVHLRMSGRLLARKLADEPLKFERTRIDFNNVSLRFCDMRKFGKVWINKKSEYEKMTGIENLGVEPLSKDFTLKSFTKMLEGKRGAIKKWLLDQSLIAGVGNIYADESCFYAGIRPDHRVEKLTPKDLEKLHEAIVKALKQGIKNRGTSISDYADAFGKKGTNQEVLFVYGRGGKKCLKCGGILSKAKVAGRGTVFCEKCQK